MTRTRILPAAAVLVALALTGCSSEDADPPAAAPTASPTASASPSPAASGPDSYAVRACKRAADAIDAAGDGLDELAAAAYEAQQSSEQKIARAGALLDEQVKLAEAAQGASDEAVMEAGATAGALKFTGTCAEVGLVN
ncbi:hypothetical protein [Micromonospora aurantiaca]|uniref:Uncharacterized protein n=1 Tax=Micromonospora aurantiaca (nom. illeg.) TaxID=47850 RepID=A0A6N3JX00_9ACTN|nr:hypothetical protein [Micromonospora aurantiaca]AXH89389.1 hypothetical protein DVH21_05250 [Micromonospora aurantiaca]